MNGCAGGFAAAPQSGVFQNCSGNFEIAHSIKNKCRFLENSVKSIDNRKKVYYNYR